MRIIRTCSATKHTFIVIICFTKVNENEVKRW